MKLKSFISLGISVLLVSALVAPLMLVPAATASAATTATVRTAAIERRAKISRTLQTPTIIPSTLTSTTIASPPQAVTDRWVGAYVSGSAENLTNLTTLEGKTGQKFAVRNFFQNTTQGFTQVQSAAITSHGSIPLITLEFWNAEVSTSVMTGGSYKQIANGSMDAYLIKYATNAKNFGKPVWLRPFHEMNGDWYPWGGTEAGNTPADFIAAWRHVRTIFNNAGATNVKFVWSPNADSVPNTTANAIGKYWPGESYVDYIGIDGYNFGTTASTWRTFSSVMGPAYKTCAALSPTKPIFIAETGCGTTGGDKAAWISNMFKVIPTTYPRIIGVTWFNANKERDWRIESSTASLNAFKSAIVNF